MWIDIEKEINGVTIKGAYSVVSFNLNKYLYVRSYKPYRIYDLWEIEDRNDCIDNERISDYREEALRKLELLYRTVKIIEENKTMFESLLLNLNNTVNMQWIKFRKKVFYSENEKEYYKRNMFKVIEESYGLLFDKYIIIEEEKKKELKKYLSPNLLQRVLEKCLNQE